MADILSRLKLRDEAERLGGVRMYEKEEEGAEGEGLEGEAEEDEHGTRKMFIPGCTFLTPFLSMDNFFFVYM